MKGNYTINLSEYSFGDLMTVEEFKSCVKSGGFIDYDGSGNAVKDGMLDRRDIFPSAVKTIPEDATHINWYNR